MKDIKIPFTPFDVFSNLIPAIVFVSCVLLLGHSSQSLSLFFNYLLSTSKALIGDGKQAMAIAFLAVATAAILFCLGHAIMALGSLLLDRLLVGKGIGYPYIALFQLNRPAWDTLSAKFYLTVCSLTLVYLGVLIWAPGLFVWRLPVWGLFLAHIGLLAIIKLIISTARDYYTKTNKRTVIIENRGRKIFHFLLLGGFGIPQIIYGTFHVLKKMFHMQAFHPEFIKKFKTIFQQRYGIDMDTPKIDSSVFWLPYAEIHEDRPITSQSLQFIRVLYYFSRNLSMAFFLLYILCAVLSDMDGFTMNIARQGYIYIALSILFFIHYYNIYYNFYSKQTFRTFYVYMMTKVNSGQTEVSASQTSTAPSHE